MQQKQAKEEAEAEDNIEKNPIHVNNINPTEDRGSNNMEIVQNSINRNLTMAMDVPSSSLPPFLIKTYDMVHDISSDTIVSWSSNNNSFIIWNLPEFSQLLLPRYFKHSNFSSFVRQLNSYVSSWSAMLSSEKTFPLWLVLRSLLILTSPCSFFISEIFYSSTIMLSTHYNKFAFLLWHIAICWIQVGFQEVCILIWF